MTSNLKWGRKESIVWPPHAPIYTFSALGLDTYEPGDKITIRAAARSIEGIPHDSQATVVSTKPKGNLLTVQLDATREEVTYSPSQLRNQTRESRSYREEVREIAEGERIRFTSYDKELGIRSGDLGTVTRIGQDRSMTVQLDSERPRSLRLRKPSSISDNSVRDETPNSSSVPISSSSSIRSRRPI